LQPLRDLLGLAHHAQDVEAENLLDIALRVAALEQFRGQQRILRHVIELLHDLRDAVEVAADADVIDARDFADVIDMIGDVCDARARRRIGRRPLVHAGLDSRGAIRA
jgi:hypothetical protein